MYRPGTGTAPLPSAAALPLRTYWSLSDGPMPVEFLPSPPGALEAYPSLWNFLKNFRVPFRSPHNVRWTRLVSDYLFHLPKEALQQLPRIMAAERKRPFFLHEALKHVELHKLAVDSDGLPENVPLEDVIRRVCAIIDIPGCECHVVEAPTKRPGFRFLHFVFQCAVPPRTTISQRIKAECPAEWTLDATFTSLRMLGSDRIAKDTNDFAQRTLRYVWGNAHGDEEMQFLKCSLLAGNLEELPRVKAELLPPDVTQSVTLLPDHFALLLEEVRAVHGAEMEFYGRFKTTFMCVRSTLNLRTCHVRGGEHKRNKQRVDFYLTWWVQSCWDDDCRNSAVQHPYANPAAIKALFQMMFPPPSSSSSSSFEELRSIVIDAFPEDEDHWSFATETWSLGPYFGPRTPTSYHFDYRMSLCSIVRRLKTGPHSPCSCEVRPLARPWAPERIVFDEQLALELMRVCEEEYDSIPCLLLEKNRLDFYSMSQGDRTFAIRFNVNPPVFLPSRTHPCARVALACHAFYSSIRLLPLDLLQKAQRDRAKWVALLGNADNFIFDEGPSDAPLNYALLPPRESGFDMLIAPPGAAKTTGVVKSGFKGDILTSSRQLARNLAKRFECLHHMDADDQVLSARELLDIGQLCCVINSLPKLRDRHMAALFLDEVTAMLHSVGGGGTMRDQGPYVFSLLVDRLRYVNHVIAASADITPEIEGELFLRILGIPRVRILYKVYGPSASRTVCKELLSDSEFWGNYVRLLRYNARHPDAPVRIFLPCSTVAAVERARTLCQRYWPQGRSVFLHAQTSLPPRFVEEPNETWVNYDIICFSSTLKVGVSFERDHFHVLLGYGCTGCGSAEDLLQLFQRGRVPVPLMLYRIHSMGGMGVGVGAGVGGEELDVFAMEHGIDRSHFPEPAALANPCYKWLSDAVAKYVLHDHTHFLEKVRNHLRNRQMSVELGGVDPERVPLDFAGFHIDPEPMGDLEGPDLLQERIDAILAAPDCGPSALFGRGKSKKRSREERAKVDRYLIRKRYKPDGPFSFEQLVEKHVREKLEEKILLCEIALSDDGHLAAALDEAQYLFDFSSQEQMLRVRKSIRDLLCTLPGFHPHVFVLGAQYRISRKRLLEEPILEQQEKILSSHSSSSFLPTPSLSEDRVKRTVSHFNKMARKLGQPNLVRCKTQEEYELDPSFPRPSPVLFYANLPARGGEEEEERIVLVDPIIHDGGALLEDRHTHIRYRLLREAYYLVSYEGPLADPQYDASQTLSHIVTARARSTVRVTVSHEPFYRNRFLRLVVDPPSALDHLLQALQTVFQVCPYVAPPAPPVLTLPRLLLAKRPNDRWVIVQDLSDY